MAAKIHFFIETTKQKKKKDRTGLKNPCTKIISLAHRRHLINNRL